MLSIVKKVVVVYGKFQTQIMDILGLHATATMYQIYVFIYVYEDDLTFF